MSLARAVSKITIVNLVVFVGAFLTGPIVARALGPSGRGQLAAIAAPLALIPIVLGLGLGTFATREVASGKTVRSVLSTLLPISVVLGLIGAITGWPLAGALSQGHSTIRTFLRVGFLLAPLSLVVVVLQSTLAGQQRWNRLLVARAIPTVIAVLAIPTLFVFHALTVATAATVGIVGGAATLLPTFGLLREGLRAEWSPVYSRLALSFGARAWAGGLANIANFRLDQVLMISLTSSTQLGLYAVAVTVGTAPAVLPAAVAGPIQARVASGDRDIVGRSTRVTMLLVGVLHVIVGALAVPVVTVLFGPAFTDSILMIWVLLAAGVPFAGGLLLSSVLSADGAPGRTAVAQFLALAVTIPLLLVLVPGHGGMGAAVTSAAAYSTSFIVLVRATVTRGLVSGTAALLVPRREDAVWLWGTGRGWLHKLRGRGETA